MSENLPDNGNENEFKMGRRNIGALHDNTIKDKELTAKVLAHNLQLYRIGRDKPTSVQELEDRFDMVIELCAQSGIPPTVESLVLVSGFPKSSFWEIAQGLYHPEFSDTIKKAKDYIQTYDSAMATMGKVNAPVYIFRAKNFYDMKDVQEIKAVPQQDPTIPKNENDIINALPEVPVIETPEVDK